MLPNAIPLPPSLLARASPAPVDGPLALTLDLSIPSALYLQQTDESITRLPAAESTVALLAAGIPAPEPMTLGVTRFRRSDGGDLVVCSELAENRGASVTNAWPQLATALVREWGLDPEKTTFIEHYHPGSYAASVSDGVKKDSFDRVVLTWSGGRASMDGWQHVAS